MAGLADVVVGALLASVPVPDDGHAPAPVAGDALVLAEEVGLLLPPAGYARAGCGKEWMTNARGIGAAGEVYGLERKGVARDG